MSETAAKKKFTTQIKSELCKACCYCIASCPKDVFVQGTEINRQGYLYITVADIDRCIGCLSCINICPDFAITVDERAS